MFIGPIVIKFGIWLDFEKKNVLQANNIYILITCTSNLHLRLGEKCKKLCFVLRSTSFSIELYTLLQVPGVTTTNMPSLHTVIIPHVEI